MTPHRDRNAERFDERGNNYFCSLHPKMQGQIITG